MFADRVLHVKTRPLFVGWDAMRTFGADGEAPMFAGWRPEPAGEIHVLSGGGGP